jgi:hypothetical protein
LRPPAHKSGFFRLLEPRYVGNTNGRRRYSSTKNIQIEEWKYCTDYNLSHTSQSIRAKYTPLANAIRQHWPDTAVDILSIVMNRTGTPHSSTITSLTSLLTLRTDPLDKLISKARLDTSRIIAQLHTHTVQWLHHLLLNYRTKSRTTTRRAPTIVPTHAPTCTPPSTRIELSPGRSKTPSNCWRGWIRWLTV